VYFAGCSALAQVGRHSIGQSMLRNAGEVA